ncbi:methionyl-tRNA formyltransferase [Ohessyouella blattaphilus]|uniref:Methionyl-tRNA formyltransferase n=1 Tax=Ohessyouella blattaphilus TaxID=2949333 RepID=A0ABT1EDN1_9FIRM|nr:methionyl-tRNA formyltransferase [Ohessyouella blattaphilus]MCP1108810.1 methionyl-tRNA formyltransferase [Ohessyouella blattaphilus]MCR8562204.1 methionyl-tRNA formyltransferase [Ohessyouella blattaphilus]
MRVIFMGTPDFAAPTLEAIVKAGHQVVLAVTQPDKPKGRGKQLAFSPVKEMALKCQIPVFQPDRIRKEEHLEELRKYPADVMVVVAFGQILPKAVLEMTPYGCINVHASLLPKYRGAAPIQWSIIDGEKETGVTTMQMDEGLDTGDMLLKTVITIEDTETGGSLHDKLQVAGAKLLVETLKGLEAGTLKPKSQPEASPTAYAKMLDKALGDIQWEQEAKSIERLIRGLNPWPSAYSRMEDKVYKIWQAEVLNQESEALPGTITETTRDGITVQTGKGSLRITQLQAPGKKRMKAEEYLRGHQLEIGTVFNR